jgi:hypothetical protein
MRPALALLTSAGMLAAQAPARRDDGDPARAFFASGAIVRIAIGIPEAGRQRLRNEPRVYVPCTVQVDGGKFEWRDVGIKLKGAAGSFRELDDKPGLTLNLDKFGETQDFHGLRKFHLDNSVQDDTYLCEWLGAEVFAAAGLPAARVAHARVVLDGRDLGLYVLREAYDRQFLLRAFGAGGGNLYDGGFCQDVDCDLEKDAGGGADDRGDLRRLREACRSEDPGRAERLSQVVDVEAFVDFVALEAMLCHWDGYSQNRNNYRLCFEPHGGRAVFLPHGMDQLLGDVEASVLRHPTAIVADAVMQQPQWRRRYRERLAALMPLLQPKRLQQRIAAIAAKLRAALHEFDPEAASAHAAAVRGLQERLVQRHRNLLAQAKAPEPVPLSFEGQRPVAVAIWHPGAETEQIELGRKRPGAAPVLQIACTGRGPAVRAGGFRTSVLLARGRYRLSASVSCDGIVPPGGADPDDAGGVWLRGGDGRSESLVGDHRWRQLDCEFAVGEFQREVELELHLRATAGRASFRADSLQLVRLPD